MEKSCAGCVDLSTCVKDQRAKSLGCKYHLEQNAFLTKEEEAPLKLCAVCKHPTCIRSGKLCRKVERLLPKIRSGGHSKEFPSDNVEILYQLHKEKESGWRKKPHLISEDYEGD